jgi:hypothetical protein
MPVTRYGICDADPSPLWQPLDFAFSKRTAKNRILKAAMEERLSTWDDKILENRGVPTKELLTLYQRYIQASSPTFLHSVAVLY